ncbi:MAG: hypothetical protein E7000_09430 [Coriobacteriaceae bacterium]|nr:hypothetical protein [Coriobacteriaceae bacterium]
MGILPRFRIGVARVIAAVFTMFACALALQLFLAGLAHASETDLENDLSCTYVPGGNVNGQDYERWSAPVKSYLVATDDGYMRVQGDVTGYGVVVVYYDKDFNAKSRKVIPQELELFGGFYYGDGNYYLVTGQPNVGEDDAKEVFRATKYYTDWSRLQSCSWSGVNVSRPFDGGSCRMDLYGDNLVIRTGRQMYLSSDGMRHQSNATLYVDTAAMSILGKPKEVSAAYSGYVSHSFNQFIKHDGYNGYVSVDHGDGYPRAICLMKLPTVDVFNPAPSANDVSIHAVLKIPGDVGENVTGASVGGLEISPSAYLVAGNSVVQDANNLTRTTRNVFVMAVDKETGAVAEHWLTDYAEGDGTTSTPHLVKVSDSRYLVLWARAGNVHYAFVDDQGRKQGREYSFEGNLSDCVPIIDGGDAVWYSWRDGSETFYRIPLDNPGNAQVVEHSYDHAYEYAGTKDGVVSFTCSKCGAEKTGVAPTGYEMWWSNTSTDGGGYYRFIATMQRGQSLAYWIRNQTYPSGDGERYSEFTIESDRPDSCVVDTATRTITFNEGGVFTLTVYPTYNPDAKQTFTVRVRKPLEGVALAVTPAEVEFGDTLELAATADGGKGSLRYTFAVRDAQGVESTIVEGDAYESHAWTPPAAGTYRLRASVTDLGDGNKTMASDEVAVAVKPAAVAVASGGSVSATGQLIDGQQLREVGISGNSFVAKNTGKSVAGTFAIDGPSRVLPVGTHSVGWTFTPDSANYLPCTGAMTVTVAAKPEPSSSGSSAGSSSSSSTGGASSSSGGSSGSSASSGSGSSTDTSGSGSGSSSSSAGSSSGSSSSSSGSTSASGTSSSGAGSSSSASGSGGASSSSSASGSSSSSSSGSSSSSSSDDMGGASSTSGGSAGKDDKPAEPAPIPTPELPTTVSGEVSPANPVSAETAEAAALATADSGEPAGSAFSLLQAKGAAKSKTSVKLTWKKVKGATTYVVYGNKCGKKYHYERIAEVTGTSFMQKKLKKGTYYKYLVVALKGDAAIATSKTVHVATKGGKAGNDKAVKVACKSKVTLKKGKKLKLKAKAVAQSKKLKVKKHRAIAYESSNTKIATVNKKGVVKAKAKGTCKVYAYAQNGVCKAVKVTVK